MIFTEHTEVPSVTITSSTGITGVSTTSSTPSSPSMTGLQPSNHRRKKPKRRSTGVVNLDMDVSYSFFNITTISIGGAIKDLL